MKNKKITVATAGKLLLAAAIGLHGASAVAGKVSNNCANGQLTLNYTLKSGETCSVTQTTILNGEESQERFTLSSNDERTQTLAPSDNITVNIGMRCSTGSVLSTSVSSANGCGSTAAPNTPPAEAPVEPPALPEQPPIAEEPPVTEEPPTSEPPTMAPNEELAAFESGLAYSLQKVVVMAKTTLKMQESGVSQAYINYRIAAIEKMSTRSINKLKKKKAKNLNQSDVDAAIADYTATLDLILSTLR